MGNKLFVFEIQFLTRNLVKLPACQRVSRCENAFEREMILFASRFHSHGHQPLVLNPS